MWNKRGLRHPPMPDIMGIIGYRIEALRRRQPFRLPLANDQVGNSPLALKTNRTVRYISLQPWHIHSGFSESIEIHPQPGARDDQFGMDRGVRLPIWRILIIIEKIPAIVPADDRGVLDRLGLTPPVRPEVETLTFQRILIPEVH